MGRALLLRCPRCGGRGIWSTFLRMRHACPTCRLVFERGESTDFWIGAYLVNLVAAELAAVLLGLLLWIMARDALSFNALWGSCMALAVVMPVLFFPFSRTLWLAWDLYFRPREAGDEADVERHSR